ncbi:MAG: hypothetical protein NC094_01760 [Bacteroidales bacterium]|nr:hypothetical protein [Lachnoclostridium sp.]MCM1385396.1 hypothetical protein [Lachnoclostridium sp.]MCM1464122.1 hypothetical protein [Bacteroidales bacterium]
MGIFKRKNAAHAAEDIYTQLENARRNLEESRQKKKTVEDSCCNLQGETGRILKECEVLEKENRKRRKKAAAVCFLFLLLGIGINAGAFFYSKNAIKQYKWELEQEYKIKCEELEQELNN